MSKFIAVLLLILMVCGMYLAIHLAVTGSIKDVIGALPHW
jgi:hypothetical protein